MASVKNESKALGAALSLVQAQTAIILASQQSLKHQVEALNLRQPEEMEARLKLQYELLDAKFEASSTREACLKEAFNERLLESRRQLESDIQ